jgi:hypothetical protein
MLLLDLTDVATIKQHYRGLRSGDDRFNNAKQPVPRATKTPAAGVGDDAYYIYIENSGFMSNVGRGTSAFEVHLFGVHAWGRSGGATEADPHNTRAAGRLQALTLFGEH